LKISWKSFLEARRADDKVAQGAALDAGLSTLAAWFTRLFFVRPAVYGGLATNNFKS
jgi:hypothetical protein